nr:PREDICTED: uncharacterized protein LOC107778667 [Nicotiana tabacum]
MNVSTSFCISACIFQAIFHGSVGMDIDKLGQQLSAMEVHRYPANGLYDALYSVSTIWCSVKEANAKGTFFSVSSDHMQLSEVLLLCRIGFFVAENVMLGMARNLRGLLCIFPDEVMYVYVMLELSWTSRISPKLNELLSYFSKTALKTFLVVSSMSHSWFAIDSFLVKTLVYSCFLFSFELQNRQLVAQYHMSNAKLPINVILDSSELLVKHEVFEPLWEGNYIFIKDGIRLMHQIKFLHGRPTWESSKASFVEFIMTLLAALLYGVIQAFDKVLRVNRQGNFIYPSGVLCYVEKRMNVVDMSLRFHPSMITPLALKSLKLDLLAYGNTKFQNVTFTKIVAVIGGNSSGESIVALLLERFYDPIDFKDQEPESFAITILEIILYRTLVAHMFKVLVDAFAVIELGKNLFVLWSFDAEHSLIDIVDGLVVAATSTLGYIFFLGHCEHFGMTTICCDYATSTIPDSNLKDKVLFEDMSIVMNGLNQNELLGPGSGLHTSQDVKQPNKRLLGCNWDPG